ncbi:MAG TPA: UbiA family prenyltransferase [Mycobacteriales bacterium]|jgi:4-hydroxybenzoate polyprenyltransferase|nr:UbiA family prenyltransferase [Mycobacteriales bacterium]
MPTLAVTAFFTAVALAAGLGARSALLALAVVVGQASIGWANDFLDAGRDRAASRADKPLAAGDVRDHVVGRCAAVALVADVPLSLAVGWRPGAAHLIAVGSAWMYNLQLKYTWASWTPYVLSFGLVPVIVATALPGAPLPQATLVAAGSCCGVAAHFANTVGDAADDALTGVRGLPQRIGPSASTIVAAVFVAVASLLLVVATDAAVPAVAAAVVGTTGVLAMPWLLRRSTGRHVAFRVVIAAVAVMVVAFVVSGGDRLVAK